MQKTYPALKYFILCLLCLSSAWAADLQTCSEVYRKNCEEIRLGSQSDFEKLQQDYGKQLEVLRVGFQKQGDLNKAKAARAEGDRFRKSKLLPAEPDEKEIPEIIKLQSDYVSQYSKLEQELVRKLGARTVRYEQDLGHLVKDLTKAGKLDEATAGEAEQITAQGAVKNFTEQLAELKGGKPTRVGSPDSSEGRYLVIDLSAGSNASKYPVSHLSDVPEGGWSDEFKTEKLVLRRIEPGTFVMGSPEDELGRNDDETQHSVTLTRAFYFGIFEVTQRQWELVMGDRPSYFQNSYASRPVDSVTYSDIRGASDGNKWPESNSVDATSFVGKLRTRTGKTFDLPTEAQWEYVCRSGSNAALNSGKDLATTNRCANLQEVGRCGANVSGASQDCDTLGGTAKVGSYQPSAWGCYDTHGNLNEWCLDWRSRYTTDASDPKGAIDGRVRVLRGGCWIDPAARCRSACRSGRSAETSRLRFIGFRAACALDGAAPAEIGSTRLPEPKAEGEKTDISKPDEQEAPAATGKKISLLLDAKSGKRDGNTKSSYAKVRNLKCDITIRLTSFDVKQVEAQVKAFFVGRDGDDRRLVADMQEITITLDSSKGWTGSFTSKDIREQTPYYYYYYYNDSKRWVSGAKLEGWIVQVWVDDQLITQKASVNPLLKYVDVVKEMGMMQEGTKRTSEL